MTKELNNQEVVEAEFTEVVEEAAEQVAIKCAITVGMTEKGDIFFNVDGSDQNLLMMDGLLKYAERHMGGVWSERLSASKAE